MIASIEGVVTGILEDCLVINISGMGFKVLVSQGLRERAELHKSLGLHTYLVVREESLTLYGFESAEERNLFSLLLSVSGVGPRTSMTIVSNIPLDTIKAAIAKEKPELLSGTPGVGKKTAQSIVLHLHGKFMDTGITSHRMSDLDGDVISALSTLGYSVVEAQTAVQMIPKDTPDNLEDRIRAALKYFS